MLERHTTTRKNEKKLRRIMSTELEVQKEEANINQWERCGCTSKCGRLKRRNVPNGQERPPNI